MHHLVHSLECCKSAWKLKYNSLQVRLLFLSLPDHLQEDNTAPGVQRMARHGSETWISMAQHDSRPPQPALPSEGPCPAILQGQVRLQTHRETL